MLKPILRFFASIGSGIIVKIIVGLFGIAALISYVTHTLNYIIQIIKSPTPLWATIALVFLVIGYIKLKKSPSFPASKVKNELIEAENFKWETRFQNNSVLSVSEIPFCKIHELRLTKMGEDYHCMENDCKTNVKSQFLPTIYKVAFNHIERYIRNKKC